MPRSEAYNVDCLDYMRTLPAKSFDLAIVDPPYWSPEEQTGRVRTAGNVQATLDLGNKFNQELFDELKRVSKAQIVWGANNYGFPFKGFVVWDKTNIPDKFTLSKCEIASLSDNLGKTAKIFRAPSSYFGLQRIHPTQKPVELYAWLLSTYAPPQWRIFDPMLGSQSSRIAAYMLGYDFVGCELDPDFYAKGCARFEAECRGITKTQDGRTQQQLQLFDY